jgi:hypothetical protein
VAQRAQRANRLPVSICWWGRLLDYWLTFFYSPILKSLSSCDNFTTK